MSKFSDATLYLAPSGYKEGILFPQKPLSTNGEISFTRASSAWRTNIEGQVEEVCYNLLQYSEEFNDAVWTKSGSTITANATTAPNGTLTADKFINTATTSTHIALQTVSFPSNIGATCSIYAKAAELSFIYVGGLGRTPNANEGYVFFNLSNGTVGSSDSGYSGVISNEGNGWYKLTVTAPSMPTSASREFRIGVSNANGIQSYTGDGTSGVFIWGAQLVQGSLPRPYLSTTTRQNFPRVDYSLGTGTFLLEPQRTNLSFNSGWTGGGSSPTNWNSFITGTTSAVASIKNNSVTAYQFSVTSQRAFFAQSISTTIGTTYSLSIYCESVTTTQKIEDTISGGAVVAYYKNGVAIAGTTNIEAGNFYSMTLTAFQVSTDIRIGAGVAGNITANVVLSMPQFEQGAYSSSFILTPSAATTTRIADSFSRGNIFTNNLISSSGGTWFVELCNNISYIRDLAVEGLLLSSDSIGTTNSFLINGLSGGGRLKIAKYVGGAFTQLYITTTTTVKIAIKWNGTTADIFANGTKVVSATSFTPTSLEFLAHTTSGDVPKFIQQMALWRTPLTDAQCQELTL